MDQDFAFLIDGNLACGALGLGLRAVQRGVSGIAFAANGPAFFTGDNPPCQASCRLSF